jgi:hypothetical protein
MPVTCQLHLNSCPDHLSNYRKQLIANSLSLSMLNLWHPLVTWHIANKCRIPGTCHVTPLHPPVICHPCIPLSSVTPASPCHLSPLHPPVIGHPCFPSPCHLSYYKCTSIPVTCHVTPSALPYPLSFMLPTHFKFLSLCYVTSPASSPVVTPHKHVNSCHLSCKASCIPLSPVILPGTRQIPVT